MQQNVELKVNLRRVPRGTLKLSTFRQNKRAMNPLNWCATRQVDNLKNKNYFSAQYYAGQFLCN